LLMGKVMEMVKRGELTMSLSNQRSWFDRLVL
jgi:hypothetical protein